MRLRVGAAAFTTVVGISWPSGTVLCFTVGFAFVENVTAGTQAQCESWDAPEACVLVEESANSVFLTLLLPFLSDLLFF